MILLYPIIDIIGSVLTFAIIARVLISWFPVSRANPLVTIIYQITEPILAPLRRVIPMIGIIDITPLAAIILIQLIMSFIRLMLI